MPARHEDSQSMASQAQVPVPRQCGKCCVPHSQALLSPHSCAANQRFPTWHLHYNRTVRLCFPVHNVHLTPLKLKDVLKPRVQQYFWTMINFRTLLGRQISLSCIHDNAYAADVLWELYDHDKACKVSWAARHQQCVCVYARVRAQLTFAMSAFAQQAQPALAR